MEAQAAGNEVDEEVDQRANLARLLDAWEQMDALRIHKAAIQKASEQVVAGRTDGLTSISASYLTQLLNGKKDKPTVQTLRTVALSMHNALQAERRHLKTELVDEAQASLAELMTRLSVAPMTWDLTGEAMGASSLTAVAVEWPDFIRAGFEHPGSFMVIDGPLKGGRSVALAQLGAVQRELGATVKAPVRLADIVPTVSSPAAFWTAMSRAFDLPPSASNWEEFIRLLAQQHEAARHLVLLVDDITILGGQMSQPWGWDVLTSLLRSIPQFADGDQGPANLSIAYSMTGSSRHVTSPGPWLSSITAATTSHWLPPFSVAGIDSLIMRYATRFPVAFPSVRSELDERRAAERSRADEIAELAPKARQALRAVTAERDEATDPLERAALTSQMSTLRAEIKREVGKVRPLEFGPTSMAKDLAVWTGGHPLLTHATIDALASGAESLTAVLERPAGIVAKFRSDVLSFLTAEWVVEWPCTVDGLPTRFDSTHLERAAVTNRNGTWASKFMEMHFKDRVLT